MNSLEYITNWANMDIPTDPTSMAGLLMGIQMASRQCLGETRSCRSAIEVAAKLPPDVLTSPFPYPSRIDYAAKLIDEAWEKHRSLIRRFLHMVEDGKIRPTDFSDIGAADNLIEEMKKSLE